MIGLFAQSIDKLDESEIRNLVESQKIREYIQLDYKQEAYNHNHDGAVEMLADITAMANAQGGYIIIGVEEDKSEAEGTPKALIGLKSGAAEANWIQSVCLSSIDERLSGLQVRDVPIGNDLSCVVIEIPNSFRKPHMVVHEKHRSFRMRHGRDKSFMGMQEVRNMVLSMNAYQTSLREFIAERKDAIKETAKDKPCLLLMATPIYVDADKLDPLRDEMRDLLERAPGNPDNDSWPDAFHCGRPQPRIFGAEAGLGIHDEVVFDGVRLFRNGHFEYCSQRIATNSPADWPTTPMPIYPYYLAVTILHFVELVKRVMLLAEVNQPLALTVHLVNCRRTYLQWWAYNHNTPMIFNSGQALIWKEDTLTIDYLAVDLTNPNLLARDILDRLFAAYGSETKYNNCFDMEGHFLRDKT